MKKLVLMGIFVACVCVCSSKPIYGFGPSGLEAWCIAQKHYWSTVSKTCAVLIKDEVSINGTVSILAEETLAFSNIGGSILNNGTINNHGTISNGSTLNNNGTINNYLTVNNNRRIVNTTNGTIRNYGTIINSNFDNHSTIDNHGTLTMDSDGKIYNWRDDYGGIIRNYGEISGGYFDNRHYGTIYNYGTINSMHNSVHGTVYNYGHISSIYNYVGGMIYNLCRGVVDTYNKDGVIYDLEECSFLPMAVSN